MNPAPQKNWFLIAGLFIGVLVITLLFIKAISSMMGVGEESEKNKNSNTQTQATATPLPATNLAEQQLQQQIIGVYFPQCHGNTYAMNAREVPNYGANQETATLYNLYELESVRPTFNVGDVTTPAHKKNGKTVFRALIFFNRQGAPIHRMTGEQTTFPPRPFGPYIDGSIPPVEATSINGKWSLPVALYRPLTCKEVDIALGNAPPTPASPTPVSPEDLQRQLADSLNEAVTRTRDNLFIKCEDSYYAMQRATADDEDVEYYLIRGSSPATFNAVYINSVSLEAKEIPVTINFHGKEVFKKNKTKVSSEIKGGTPLGFVRSTPAPFILAYIYPMFGLGDLHSFTFVREGSGWKTKDTKGFQRITCGDVSRMKKEVVLVE